MGFLLIFFGFSTADNSQMYKNCMGINANIWWGIVLIIFGLIMYFFGRRAHKSTQLQSVKMSAPAEFTKETVNLEDGRNLIYYNFSENESVKKEN